MPSDQQKFNLPIGISMQGIEPAYILVILQRHRSACTFGTRGTPLYFLSPPQAGPGALLSFCFLGFLLAYSPSIVVPELLRTMRPRHPIFSSLFGPRVLRSLLFCGFLFGFSVPFYSTVFSSGSPFPSILRFSGSSASLLCGSRVISASLLWPSLAVTRAWSP